CMQINKAFNSFKKPQSFRIKEFFKKFEEYQNYCLKAKETKFTPELRSLYSNFSNKLKKELREEYIQLKPAIKKIPQKYDPVYAFLTPVALSMVFLIGAVYAGAMNKNIKEIIDKPFAVVIGGLIFIGGMVLGALNSFIITKIKKSKEKKILKIEKDIEVQS
ncbi:MAG: hypothetical protein ACK4J0_02495, partial [Candidatus Anstonellaceae archaeon]